MSGSAELQRFSCLDACRCWPRPATVKGCGTEASGGSTDAGTQPHAASLERMRKRVSQVVLVGANRLIRPHRFEGDERLLGCVAALGYPDADVYRVPTPKLGHDATFIAFSGGRDGLPREHLARITRGALASSPADATLAAAALLAQARIEVSHGRLDAAALVLHEARALIGTAPSVSGVHPRVQFGVLQELLRDAAGRADEAALGRLITETAELAAGLGIETAFTPVRRHGVHYPPGHRRSGSVQLQLMVLRTGGWWSLCCLARTCPSPTWKPRWRPCSSGGSCRQREKGRPWLHPGA